MIEGALICLMFVLISASERSSPLGNMGIFRLKLVCFLLTLIFFVDCASGMSFPSSFASICWPSIFSVSNGRCLRLVRFALMVKSLEAILIARSFRCHAFSSELKTPEAMNGNCLAFCNPNQVAISRVSDEFNLNSRLKLG